MIDGYYCITIPRLEHRKQGFIKAWDGLDVEFSTGVDYQDQSYADICALLAQHGKTPFPNYSVAFLAITLSHVLLWRKLLDGDGNKWIIFEDDARPAAPIDKILEVFTKEYSYDVVKFLHVEGYDQWVGATCYSINRKAVEIAYKSSIAMTVDILLDKLFGSKLYQTRPSLLMTLNECSYDSIDALGSFKAFHSEYCKPPKKFKLIS